MYKCIIRNKINKTIKTKNKKIIKLFLLFEV